MRKSLVAGLVAACAAAACLAGDDATRMKSGMMNPGSKLGTVERIGGGDFKVLVYGNSIALHAPKPDIGWTNNWGMAASAPERDFAHLVVAGLEAKLGRKADFRIRNLAVLERNFTTNVATVAEIAADANWKPDYVVVAIGENVRSLGKAEASAYRRFLADLARPFAAGGGEGRDALAVLEGRCEGGMHGEGRGGRGSGLRRRRSHRGQRREQGDRALFPRRRREPSRRPWHEINGVCGSVRLRG